MMWPGLEARRGLYNYTYLRVARDITNKYVGICMKGGEVGAVEGGTVCHMLYKVATHFMS